MIVEKNLVQEAKDKLGEDAAVIIAQDLNIENFDEKNLKGCCPFHNESTPSFIWNDKNNSFHCFGCSKSYNIIDHYMSFNKLTYLGAVERLFLRVGINYRFGERGVKTDRDFRYPNHEQNESRKTVEKYLQSRKISVETLDYTDVQEDNNGNIVFHFYDNNDVLSLVKYRPARKVTKSEPKTWCQVGSGSKPILFNMNRIDSTVPLIITEGEIDCLSVIESGYGNAVSVPLGSGNLAWIEENWDFLEQFDKIIVWSDNDTPGITMRKEICARLGSWRTYFVDLPTKIEKDDGTFVECKDANEVLFYFDKQKVLEFIENAEETPIQGVVDLADVDDFDLENAMGLYTHIKPVDKIVYKFLFGSVVALTGKKGSGKSSLLNQIFINESIDQGHDVFCFSGELDAKILKSWIEINMAGSEHIKMKSDFVHVIDSASIKPMREWYKSRIWIHDENSNNADKVLEKAIALTRKNGVKVWILDNLMTLDIGANDTNVWQKQKDFIVKLTGLAKLYNVLIILVIHPRKTNANFQPDLTTDDLAGSGDLGNMAAYIISVHRFSQAEKDGEPNGKGGYKRGKEPVEHDVAIDVLKNRYTGKLGRALTFFSYPDYRFYSDNQELFRRYKWNKDDSPIPTRSNRQDKTPDFMKD